MDGDIGDSMVTSMSSDELSSIAALGDVALDAIFDEGLFREIPILSTLVATSTLVRGIRERVQFKKVLEFLRALSRADAEQRDTFVKRLGSESEKARFGETILQLLDHADDTRKARILGNLWAACARGEIPYDKAERMSFMVNRAYAGDFSYLATMKIGPQRECTPIAESLHAAGFVSNYGFDGGDISDPLSGGVRYGRNEFADLLLAYGLDASQSSTEVCEDDRSHRLLLKRGTTSQIAGEIQAPLKRN